VGGRFQTDGLYARCRHPVYFFTALFFSAWPTMDLRALVIAIWLWAYSYVGSIFEERKLVTELGAAYVAYRERTPRLLPFGRRGEWLNRAPSSALIESETGDGDGRTRDRSAPGEVVSEGGEAR
jgi:hypothetical protein